MQRHRTFDELRAQLDALPAAPDTHGRVHLLVTRRESGHETLAQVRLTADGMPGDAWGRRLPLNPAAQLTVMQVELATLFANGQPLDRFGDNLFVELDLTSRNLPIGSRLRLGEAIVEVTPKPHNGCRKFEERFGEGALQLVKLPELRHRNLRGIYVQVVEPGEVRPGDAIDVLARA